MEIKTTFIRILILGLAFLMLVWVAVPVFAAPKSTDNKVRIGFYESSGMFSKSGNGEKSGYSYEYMMQLAVYAGWNYEFCYGSFDELYAKLKAGDIDILPYTNYNDQRATEVLFSDDVLADEEYYVVVDPDNEKVSATDIKTLDGGTIATIKGADFNKLLLDYFDENNLDIELIYYPVFEDCWKALRQKKVDATIYTSLGYSNDGWKCVCNFGAKPTYIAVSKSRQDIVNQLNEAVRLANQDRPSLLGELYEKYFPDNPMRSSLTREEQEWIDAHPVLHVGCFTNDAPYIYSYDNETGTATGLTVDVISEIIQKLDIKATADFHCYNSLEEMEAALDSGEIDVIAPFYPDFYIAQQRNLIISNTFRVSNMELVYKKGLTYQEAIEKIATPATKLGIYYTQDTFPDSKIIGANSIDDAVNRVLSGEATGAVAQNVALHQVKEQYDELDYVILTKGCGTCFAARPENSILIRILNRGTNYLSVGEISAIADRYSYAKTEKPYTVSDFIRDYFIWIILIIILIALAFVIMQRNNTRRVKLALDEAENANSAKSRFLFNMSHDIRTPLNAITGFTAMAKKHSGDEEKVNDYLDKIDTSGQQLLSLVNQVLEMARIESGQIELNEKPVDIREEFGKMITVLTEQTDANGQIFEHSLEDIRHYNVFLDDARMNSITLNLAGNALKFTPEGGKISLRLKEVAGRKTGYATYVLTVEDNGIGMSEEYQKSLFEPFTREQSSTVSRIQGTGLGMSIVKSLVDLQNGSIEVQSEPGRGTRFDITLDFRINEAADTEDASAESDRMESDAGLLRGRRVLLVEDNEMNREIARDILEDYGLEVEEADDGDVAVEMVRKVLERGDYHYYDFILMDIQMPRMNGFEATKAIRALPPLDLRIPIIAMTANAFEEDRRHAFDAGMDEHLPKPIDVDRLIHTIAKILK